jgi:hypothetical protein
MILSSYKELLAKKLVSFFFNDGAEGSSIPAASHSCHPFKSPRKDGPTNLLSSHGDIFQKE